MNPDVLTILLALAGSTGFVSIVNGLVNIRKASKADLKDLEDKLKACHGDCMEAKAIANSHKVEIEDWKFRYNRKEEEMNRRVSALEQAEAAWRDKASRHEAEVEHWRNRWMNETNR